MKLFEVEFDVITQHVNGSTIGMKVLANANWRSGVLTNIVAKTNMKLGGNNYKVQMPPK